MRYIALMHGGTGNVFQTFGSLKWAGQNEENELALSITQLFFETEIRVTICVF